MRGSTKQTFWTGLKRALGFQQQIPAAVIQAELKNDRHTVPPEERQRGGKKSSGGSYRSRSLHGRLGQLRGQRFVSIQARLEFIWAGCREANRIAIERNARTKRNRELYRLDQAQGMVTA